MKLEKEKKLLQYCTSQKQKKYKNGIAMKTVTVWRVFFEWNDHLGVRQKAFTKSGFKKESEAKAFLDHLKIEYANKTGMFAPPDALAPAGALTFRRYAESYLEELLPRIQPSSRKPKLSEMKVLVNYFGDTALADITRQHLKEFKESVKSRPVEVEVKVRAETQAVNPETGRKHFPIRREVRARPRAVSTVNHYLKRLRAMLQTAVRDDVLEKVISFYDLIDSAEETKRELTITFEELERLLSVCDVDMRLQTLGLFETGARLSELKAIRRKDINFETQIGFVLNSKRRKKSERTWRMCYFPNRLIAELRAAGKEQLADEDFVFAQGDFKKAWATAKRRAGVNLGLQQKDLRRTHRTNLAQAGVSEIVGDKQIGHGEQTLSRRVYQTLRDDYVTAEMKKYEQFSGHERAKVIKTVGAHA